MLIVQVVGLALVLAMLLVLLRPVVPALAVQLSLVGAALLLLVVLNHVWPLLRLMEELAHRAGVRPVYMETVLRVVGMAYVTEFGAHICRDAGESALAAKVELVGRVLILVMAVPILFAVLELLMNVLA